MFIARHNRNLRKPRRGSMVLSRTCHAAPTGLAERIGGTVTINMSLLRSWPNPAGAEDGGSASLSFIGYLTQMTLSQTYCLAYPCRGRPEL